MIASQMENMPSAFNKTDKAVSVEGYIEKIIAEESKYLDGDGAFMMLIELRENPKKTLAMIGKGFKRK